MTVHVLSDACKIKMYFTKLQWNANFYFLKKLENFQIVKILKQYESIFARNFCYRNLCLYTNLILNPNKS